jgi:small ubiquitin-related modifier
LYDGQKLREDQTPAQCGMEEGDMIDAMLQQIGGMGLGEK